MNDDIILEETVMSSYPGDSIPIVYSDAQLKRAAKRLYVKVSRQKDIGVPLKDISSVIPHKGKYLFTRYTLDQAIDDGPVSLIASMNNPAVYEEVKQREAYVSNMVFYNDLVLVFGFDEFLHIYKNGKKSNLKIVQGKYACHCLHGKVSNSIKVVGDSLFYPVKVQIPMCGVFPGYTQVSLAALENAVNRLEEDPKNILLKKFDITCNILKKSGLTNFELAVLGDKWLYAATRAGNIKILDYMDVESSSKLKMFKSENYVAEGLVLIDETTVAYVGFLRPKADEKPSLKYILYGQELPPQQTRMEIPCLIKDIDMTKLNTIKVSGKLTVNNLTIVYTLCLSRFLCLAVTNGKQIYAVSCTDLVEKTGPIGELVAAHGIKRTNKMRIFTRYSKFMVVSLNF